MKAYLISPEEQTITTVDVSGLDDIKSLIGFDTLESDELDAQGDLLYFDEECFLRGAAGRFQIDKLIPVSGKGVIVGGIRGDEVSADVQVSLDQLKARTRYL